MGFISPAFLQGAEASTIDPYPYSFKASNPTIASIPWIISLAFGKIRTGKIESCGRIDNACKFWLFAPERISAPGENARDPQIAAGVLREVIAVWEAEDGKNQVIQTSTKPFENDSRKTYHALQPP